MTGTDWHLIREMMAAAIDACEQIEALGYSDENRDVTIDIDGQMVSALRFLLAVISVLVFCAVYHRASMPHPAGAGSARSGSAGGNLSGRAHERELE